MRHSQRTEIGSTLHSPSCKYCSNLHIVIEKKFCFGLKKIVGGIIFRSEVPKIRENGAARGAMIPEYAVRELINIHEGVGWGGSGGWEWVEEGRGGVAVVSCRRGYIHRVYIHRAYIHRASIHKSCRFKCPRC